jgi:hypothetical protein
MQLVLYVFSINTFIFSKKIYIITIEHKLGFLGVSCDIF